MGSLMMGERVRGGERGESGFLKKTNGFEVELA